MHIGRYPALGTLKYASVDEALLWAFVVAVACAILAIFFFAAEVLMTGKGVRAEVAATKRSAYLTPRDYAASSPGIASVGPAVLR